MSVSDAIDARLLALPDELGKSWEAAVIRALAELMDDEPNASTARELRTAMKELTGGSAPVKAMGVGDDLRAKREARILARTADG